MKLSVLIAAIDWKTLIDQAPQLGFLGGIVGVVGVMLGATAAILYGFTGAFDDWKPGAESPLAGLDRMIGALVAIGIIGLWLFATPANAVTYVHLSFWLVGSGVVAFLFYIGLRVACTCTKPLVVNNAPGGQIRIWGGFWLTKQAKQAKEREPSVAPCKFLAGQGYDLDTTWPRLSRALVAMLAGLMLLVIVAGGGAGLSAAATTAQVALTKKAAKDVFGSGQVPGIPTSTPTPSATATPGA